jgi:hypothetical protein
LEHVPKYFVGPLRVADVNRSSQEQQDEKRGRSYGGEFHTMMVFVKADPL